MPKKLEWPLEAANYINTPNRWFQADSNICLDFHGDPVKAGLAIFSDGNHHMALEASLQSFCRISDDLDDIFYATMPPGVIVNILKKGSVVLGNLTISRMPDVFISPADILDKLLSADLIASHKKFMSSKGNVLLVRKGNPKNILSVNDLPKSDINLFLSNPVTEKASHDLYKNTLEYYSVDIPDNQIVYGERIHHREAPQSLYDGEADVAMLYYHLALRYTRIFTDLFEIVFLDESRDKFESPEKNLCTDYHIGLVNNATSQCSEEFIDYMFSQQVTNIYTGHGLQR